MGTAQTCKKHSHGHDLQPKVMCPACCTKTLRFWAAGGSMTMSSSPSLAFELVVSLETAAAVVAAIARDLMNTNEKTCRFCIIDLLETW